MSTASLAAVLAWAVLGPMALAAEAGAGPAEPPTRTLTAGEAQSQLDEEWLFQAGDQPLAAQAARELAWTRAMMARLGALPAAPDLATERARLDGLGRQLQALAADASGQVQRQLYLQVRQAKRQVMFKDPRLDFTSLVFIDVPERYPHESMHRVYPQAQLDCGRLLRLDGLQPGGAVTRLAPALGPGWFWRPEVSFDAQRILFCFRPAKDRTFHLYEMGLDGTGLRQLTDSSYDDLDPIYLPDGRIAFLTNRANSYARCTVGHPSTLMARCDADGGNIYILSAGGEPEYTPALLPDGRLLYTRWEYTDKELMRVQSLWTMNPDGTGGQVYWGNQSYWPDLIMEARPIPGSPRVLFAGHGHHQVYRGSIGIIDRRKGLNYPEGLTRVTVEKPWCEVGNGPADRGETAPEDYHAAGAYDGYKTPYPLAEDLFLVSAHRRGSPGLMLFLMDVHGNRELIYRGVFSTHHVMPIRARPSPPIIPDRVAWAGRQQDRRPVQAGHVYSSDIFEGTAPGLRDKARFVRVLTIDPTTFTLGKKLQDVEHPQGHPHMHVGPVMSATTNDGIKRVLGTVPIEADGSISIEVPPCMPLHFQILDAQHRCLHTMRSFANVMPGEAKGCTGCHEMHSATPAASGRGLALAKPPVRPVPYPWGAERSLGYVRDIQPILDRTCVDCHRRDPKALQAMDLSLRPSTDFGTFPEPYLSLTLGLTRARNGDFPAKCAGGIADTIIAQNMPWRPADYATLAPMTRLSYVSRLVDMASSGRHHQAQVTEEERLKLIVWVDTLCPYRGEREVREMDDPDPAQPLFRRSDYPPSDHETVQDVYAQSPYRPRMRTAPLVDRAFRQDEFPSVESRLPRDAAGAIIPPVSYTADGTRVVAPDNAPGMRGSGTPVTH